MAMTLIEGVGDEVTLFFVLAVLAVVACLAWLTTRVTDRPLRIQTIIVGQRVIHVDERGEPTSEAPPAEGEGAAPQPPGPAEPDCEEDEAGEVAAALQEECQQSEEQGEQSQEQGERSSGDGAAADGARAEDVEDVSQVTAGHDAPDECDASVQSGVESSTSAHVPEPVSDPVVDPASGPASDVQQQLLRRRLAFMARQTESDAPAPPAPSGAQRTHHDTPSVQRTEADTTQRTAVDTTAPQWAESEHRITVKLKFLNDTQRLAQGGRAEPLGDFKRRHFPTETAANRMVRLIFNGRVLPDHETLRECGLYHNCVVHCHVSTGPRPADAGAGAAAPAVQELDISVLLYPVLTSVVTLVWGLRLRYPDLFSGTAVLLLAVLTLVLACFAAATFLPLERLPGGGGGAAAAGERQEVPVR